MKIIVAHEGKQHSFYTAAALYEKGYLFKYITTIYDKPYSFTRIVRMLLKGKYKKKCASHKCSDIPSDCVISYCELLGLLLLMLSKFRFMKKRLPFLYNKLHDIFGKKVALYAIQNQVDAVIMYDTNANMCWKILKEQAPSIQRIMDVSIANRLFMKENYLKDIEQTKEYGLKVEQQYLWNNDNMKRYLDEISDTQYFIVASQIVKKSLLFSSVSEKQIYINPYGVDLDKFEYVEKNYINSPLKLIYVGQVSFRKGIHHLLKVMSEYQESEVELFLLGEYDPDSSIYMNYKHLPNVHFLGFVTRDILAKFYQESDVFVFPTLGEGYGLVILEALSCGVPCIVSNLAGGNDIITNGYNGFEFAAGNDEELKRCIDWFLQNPEKIKEMSRNSKESVSQQTWNNYNKRLVKIVEDINIKHM